MNANSEPGEFVNKLAVSIAASNLTHEQIASQLDYSNANIISLLIKGTLRLPLTKVQSMAIVLGLDPNELTRLWWKTYCPDISPPPPQLPPIAAAYSEDEHQ
jgi:hypothetical protein